MSELLKRNIAWGRIAYAVVAVAASAALTYYFANYLNNSADILSVIAAIFSILAGVLIAVISILGDPSMLMDQSWRFNYLKSKEIQRKLQRQMDIFILYILLLASLFAFSLVDDKTSTIYLILQHVVFFLAVLSFFASISLPFSLVRIQRDRLNNAIDSMKPAKK